MPRFSLSWIFILIGPVPLFMTCFVFIEKEVRHALISMTYYMDFFHLFTRTTVQRLLELLTRLIYF